MPQAQNKHKKTARAQIIKKPVPAPHNYKKRITSQQAAIAQKDKLIQQLKKQLAATPQTDTAGANEQAALNKRINELQVALSAATAEKEALIKKAGVVQNNNLKQSQAAARQQIQQLTTQIQQAEAENKRLSASFTTLNKDKHALMTRLAAADKAPHGPANDAAAPKNEPPEMAAIVAAYRLQADKDSAQLQMKEDEIELLRTQLSVQSKTRSGESAAAKLSASGEQQAYAIGASMGSEALNVLTTRRTQGVTVDAGLVLQGIEDAFRGQLRLGEQERNKALFDVSQQVFQNLNKIEQKNISAGKKYQQTFARKKDVVFKEGVYSRIDYPGKGKISGNDLVTVVIKEMLTDGTVINDMEAKDQALTQKLDAYPPVFREPLKRLQNHGSVTLVVPPEKAYGSKGLPPKIPPGATMVYSVRIVDSQPEPAK